MARTNGFRHLNDGEWAEVVFAVSDPESARFSSRGSLARTNGFRHLNDGEWAEVVFAVSDPESARFK